LSDLLGDKMGFKPTESDKKALEKLKPRIEVIDRAHSKR